MINPNPSRRGRMPHVWSRRRILLSVVCWVCISSVQAADDAYLEQLDQEVSKVGGVTTDTETDGAALIAVGGGETAQAASSRQAFEVLLREEHVGTYSFYRRLPERIREEIFLDYRNGASLEALREKIVDRYLHP